jgi:hypothetical protein
MARRVGAATFVAFLLLATLVGVGYPVGTASGSAQPGPFCGVCGETFDENATATNATLQMTDDGDVRWHVVNRFSKQGADRWRENPAAAKRRVRDQLDYGYVDVTDPTDLSVEMDGSTMVIEFVDRGALRDRMGLLVLPYFHGGGSPHRWRVNVGELVVKAPDGHRIVNEPTGASVEEDRVVWTGASSGSRYVGPEPGDAYVIAGAGATAGARAPLVEMLLPLDPGLYGFYGTWALFLVGLAFGLYTIQGTRLGPRRVTIGIAAVTVPYLIVLATVHPITGGTFVILGYLFVGPLLALLFGLVGGLALYAAAIYADTDQEASGS